MVATPRKRRRWLSISGAAVLIGGGLGAALVLTRGGTNHGGGGGNCAAAVARSMAVSKAELPAKLDVGQMTEVMLRRCEGDSWPDAVVACFAEVKRKDDLEQCMKQLTAGQREKLEHDMSALTVKAEPPPTCEQAFKHAMTISYAKLTQAGHDMPTMDKMGAAGIARCTQDDWSEEVRHCLFDATLEPQLAACRSKLPDDRQASLAKDLEAAAANTGSASAANTGSAADTGSAASAGGAGRTIVADPTLPRECKEYKTALEKLSKCTKLPRTSRAGLKKAFETIAKSWAELGPMTPEARRAMADRCKQDMGSIKKSRAVCQGPETESF